MEVEGDVGDSGRVVHEDVGQVGVAHNLLLARHLGQRDDDHLTKQGHLLLEVLHEGRVRLGLVCNTEQNDTQS